MLTITIKANVPAADAQGIKERRIAMDIERYGDCKVVSIASDRGREEQMKRRKVMSINVKKYTKDQMAKMVEEAQEKNAALEAKITELKNCIDKKNGLIAEYANLKAAMQQKNVMLIDRIDQMNGEAINKANEIANLKADADVLRNKLADTEAALGRANADAAQQTSFAEYHKREYDAMTERYKTAALEEWRAKNHPWRNLWAWAKRKLARYE